MEDSTNYWLRRRITRRTTLRGAAVAGLGAGALAVAGCGDDDDKKPTPQATAASTGPASSLGSSPSAAASASASASAAAKTPKPGGSIAIQLSAPPPTLDPYTQTSFITAAVNGLTYSKLYRYKAGVPEVEPGDPSMEPDLATAMPEQPDQTTYVFKLKPAAKFTNGRPLTSEDVKYAYDRYINFEKSVHKTGLLFVDKMETPDPQTFRITTKAPYADTVQYIGGNLGAYISPKEIAESPDAATKMLGSGPFILSEYQTGVSMTWKKNPDYFDKPFPYFDELKAYITPDEAKRSADFLAKNVDTTFLFLPEMAGQIKKNRPDAKFDDTLGIGSYIYLRTDKPPFNDKRVRQALSMGINRKAIRDAIAQGTGVSDQVYYVGYSFARQVKDLPQAKYWEYNPAEAKKLLAAAGVTSINTTWDHTDAAPYGQAYVDLATLTQSHLKEIGFTIKDQVAPVAQYISTTYQGQYEGMGHSPRAVAYWLDYVTERFTMRPRRGRINLSYVKDDKLDDLLDKQRAQFKLEERLQTVKQIEELVAEEQYEIYFSTDTRTYFRSPEIQNIRTHVWFPQQHFMRAWRDKA